MTAQIWLFMPSLLGAAVLLSCGRGSDPDHTVLALETGSGASHELSVEIADNPEERTVGLSGRDGLDEDAGMLFVIDRQGPGFWMRDVSFALAVAFIDGCGRIVAIAHMEPFSEEFHNTYQDYGFGLEVNEGWFARHETEVGDRLVLPDSLLAAGC